MVSPVGSSSERQSKECKSSPGKEVESQRSLGEARCSGPGRSASDCRRGSPTVKDGIQCSNVSLNKGKTWKDVVQTTDTLQREKCASVHASLAQREDWVNRGSINAGEVKEKKNNSKNFGGEFEPNEPKEVAQEKDSNESVDSFASDLKLANLFQQKKKEAARRRKAVKEGLSLEASSRPVEFRSSAKKAFDIAKAIGIELQGEEAVILEKLEQLEKKTKFKKQ